MSFTTCSIPTNVIASLGTTVEERGLTTEEFKAKFDEFATAFVAWFNATHIAEADAHLAETVSNVVLVTEPYDQVTQTTVTLGFRPKLVNIKAAILSTKYQSDGNALNGSYQYSQYTFASDSTVSIAGPVIYLAYNGSNYLSGSIAFTDTGITITWTLTGTLTGASGNRRLIISALTHGEG